MNIIQIDVTESTIGDCYINTDHIVYYYAIHQEYTAIITTNEEKLIIREDVNTFSYRLRQVTGQIGVDEIFFEFGDTD